MKRWGLLIPALVLLGVTAPIRPHDVVSGSDVDRIVNYTVEAAVSGRGWAGPHIGLSASFGYYWMLDRLPHGILSRPANVIAAVNTIAWLAALVFATALGALLVDLFGLAGIAAAALVVLSPMFIEFSLSGHPQAASVAMQLLGALALRAALRREGLAARALELVAFALLAFALTVRSDALLALPWVVWCAGRRGAFEPHGRPLGRALFVAAAAAIAFFVLQQIVLAKWGGGGTGTLSLDAFLRQFFSLRTIGYSLALLVLGGGIVLCVASPAIAAAGVTRGGAGREWIGPALLLLPVLAFWLPIGGPDRHFLYAHLALAELLVAYGARLWRARTIVGVAAAIVVLNQVAAELSYGVMMKRYQWRRAPGPGRHAVATVPMGWYLPNHRALERDLTAQRREGQALARLTDREVVVFADLIQYTIMALYDSAPVAARDTVENGLAVTRVTRGTQTFHLIESRWYWPRPGAAEYARGGLPAGARVYLQAAAVAAGDSIPGLAPARRIQLDDLGTTAH